MAKEKCIKNKGKHKEEEYFICKNCGHTAAKKKHLCRPQNADK